MFKLNFSNYLKKTKCLNRNSLFLTVSGHLSSLWESTSKEVHYAVNNPAEQSRLCIIADLCTQGI